MSFLSIQELKTIHSTSYVVSQVPYRGERSPPSTCSPNIFQDTLVIPCWHCIFLAHINFVINKDPQILFCRAAYQLGATSSIKFWDSSPWPFAHHHLLRSIATAYECASSLLKSENGKGTSARLIWVTFLFVPCKGERKDVQPRAEEKL